MKSKKSASLAAFRMGALAPFLDVDTVIEVEDGPIAAPPAGTQAVFAGYALQYVADYRGVLQNWFAAVAPGGHLVLVVSHAFLYERRLALPARRDPAQRRLYTPRSLLDEVEEALTPNSYRVRLLADRDAGYDYRLAADADPVGDSDIVLVLQKIAAPDWLLDATPIPFSVKAPTPDYAFEPQRTRVEVLTGFRPHRICALKLDHLGDFLIGMPTFALLRETFPDAEITLVVGSWNVAMARDTGFADHVIGFDAFPVNSSEAEVDVHARVDAFRAAVPGRYDLAIDLRTDHDTRRLLRVVDARLRAGIGSRAEFPFLDIFLPIDATRNEPETAREYQLGTRDFASQGPATRNDHRIVSEAGSVERFCAIVWGPYWQLRPGRYVFEPYIELGANTEGGVVMIDVALDAKRVAQQWLPTSERLRLPFEVTKSGWKFEFRIWAIDDTPSIDLNFFGGRLVRQGADSVLHQSEYSSLLVELIKMRFARDGMLHDVTAG